MSDSSSNDEGRSGKFEQLNKPSLVSVIIENSFLKDFNSLILFKIISSLVLSPHSRSSSVKRNQASFHAGLKPWCPVCSIIHWYTIRIVLLKSSGLKSLSFGYLGWVHEQTCALPLDEFKFPILKIATTAYPGCNFIFYLIKWHLNLICYYSIYWSLNIVPVRVSNPY